MAIDTQEQRQSATSVGIPWRSPIGVDPSRTGFDSSSRLAAAGFYSFGSDTIDPTEGGTDPDIDPPIDAPVDCRLDQPLGRFRFPSSISIYPY